VGLSFNGDVFPELNVPAVDAAIDSEALDWLRFNALSYILWTPSECEIIVRKTRRVPGMQNFFVFATELNFNASFGFLPPWVWDWLNKHPHLVEFKDPVPE
jgi:hypothetical protein